MKAALETGCNLWSGAEFYGTSQNNSLTLLNHYFTKYPDDADKVIILIKGGLDPTTFKPDGSPEGTRRSVDNILKQLAGKKKLDLFAPARRDPSGSHMRCPPEWVHRRWKGGRDISV